MRWASLLRRTPVAWRTDFSHAAAQKYQIAYAIKVIKRDFTALYERARAAQLAGDKWVHAAEEYFAGDVAAGKAFEEWVAPCLSQCD